MPIAVTLAALSVRGFQKTKKPPPWWYFQKKWRKKHAKNERVGDRWVIYVCDAIMGSGKSSAAITYMNEHPEKKFIYVTPFKDETIRIRNSCPALHFWVPANLDEFDGQKRIHFKYLVEAELNIATTHTLFSLCDDEAIELIRENGYTIIIDEAIGAMDRIPAKADDVKMAMNSEWFRCDSCDDGAIHEVTIGKTEYDGNWLRDLRLYASSHRLVALKDDDGENKLYCWMFNPELFYAAKDTYVLTYLFDATPMSYLFQMNEIEYRQIHVAKTTGGVYRFSDEKVYMPEYTTRLKDMIHICQSERMNAIGKKSRALSINWSKRAAKSPGGENATVLRKNLENWFGNINRDIATTPEERLWSCHSSLEKTVKGKRYSTRHLVFNSRATNDYRAAMVLAYCINVFMPLWEKRYYEQEGVVVDENLYSLSTMIQWIWRSAIRDGHEIWIYVPSSRMRKLLEDWIEEVTAESFSANELVDNTASSDELVGGDAGDSAATNEVGVARSAVTVSLDNNDGADAAPVGAQRPKEEDVA